MKYYTGIDLGGTFVKCGIVDETGRILVKDKIPTGKDRPYKEIAADIAALAVRLAERGGVAPEGAGIGSPGTVDSSRGVIVYSNNIRWSNVPLGEELSRLIGLPVAVTNDANPAALGECFCGAGSGYRNVVFVTVGTGVGGGLVLDGSLYEGGGSAGAEIGHTVIRMGGERCTCGRRGCFEAYASATALIRQTRAAMAKYAQSAMWQLCGGNADNADGKTAFDAMRAGDRAGTQVVRGYIRYLSEGIANLCNVFRPDAVLLGGGICAEGETLLAPLRKKVDAMLFGGSSYAPVRILAASLGNDAGLCGAARLAMMRCAAL